MKWILISLLFPIVLHAQNFHEVDPGKFYRSAQLSKSQFKKYIQKHGIKTVINLRGENIGDDWYDEEMEAMQEIGNIQHHDIKMSASRLPHAEDLAKLLHAYRDAPRPILVHCKAGVDRTGEASAIYLQEYMGKSKKDSLKMLSLRYGYFKKFKPAKHYFIDKLYKGEQWALTQYDPCHANYKYYDKEKYCKGTLVQETEENEFVAPAHLMLSY